MRTKLLILSICVLLSGCGLFKRVEKTSNKSQSSGKIEQVQEQAKSETEYNKMSANTTENTQTNEREQKDLSSNTTVEADEIIVDSKGNITAKGNAKVTNNTADKGNIEKNENKTKLTDSVVETNKLSFEESNSAYNEEFKQKSTEKQSVSEPDGKGIVYGVIGVLILVLGICFCFGLRPKK